MRPKRVGAGDIERAIQHLEARGETRSIWRVQREIGYDYAGVTRQMHELGLAETAMMRKIDARGERLARPRRSIVVREVREAVEAARQVGVWVFDRSV